MSLSTLSTSSLVLYGLATSLGVVVYHYARKPSHPYPPGPSPLPLIGNAHQMPTEREWLTFADWQKQYGDIVHISVLGRHIVILNTAQAVNDIFEKRSALYSDRPTLPMAGELVGYVDSVPLAHYNDRHRELRKLMFNTLAPRKAAELWPVHMEKTHLFLQELLENPEGFRSHIRLVVARIVFQISHGYAVKDETDSMLVLANRATDEFSIATAPGAFLVDLFPILQYVPAWFPGAGFQRTAKAWRETMVRIRDDPYVWVKEQLKAGTARPSFTSALIEQNSTPTPAEEDIIKWASGSFYSAGADTTVSAMEAFFLAMALHPDVLRKVQAELDAVVGPARLPTFDDRPKLPYLEAVMKEVYRWNPVANLALPHKSEKDDVYAGYLIPAGSVVFANSWAIMHDPAQYPDPLAFAPARYFAADGAPSGARDPRDFAFGYGRRVCPGQHLADASLFIVMATTAAAFDIAPPRGADGEPVNPPVAFSAGLISHPEPFAARITPRSPAHARLVREAQEV